MGKFLAFFDGQSLAGAPGGLPTNLTSPALGDKIARTYIWNNTIGAFDELVIGVNTAQYPYDADKLNRFGLEVGFAQRFRITHPTDDLLIVKAVRGGTSWVVRPADESADVGGGNWNPNLQPNLLTIYRDLIREAFDKEWPGLDRIMRVTAQGQADRRPEMWHPRWERSFRKQTALLQAIVGGPFRTSMMLLPPNDSTDQNIIDATVAFQAMQQRMASDDTLNLRLADCDHFNTIDGVHFDFAGTIGAGELLHDAAFAA